MLKISIQSGKARAPRADAHVVVRGRSEQEGGPRVASRRPARPGRRGRARRARGGRRRSSRFRSESAGRRRASTSSARGKETEISPRKARGLLRAAAKTLNRSGESSAILDFPFTLKRMDAAETREFLLRSLFLADYGVPRYKTKDAREDAARRDRRASPSGAFAGGEAREVEDAARRRARGAPRARPRQHAVERHASRATSRTASGRRRRPAA